MRNTSIIVLLFLFLSPLSAYSGLPRVISPPGEKVIVVDPNSHAWGAYEPGGRLIRSGLASAGANWCADLGRVCHTEEGRFRIRTLGSGSCKSPSFPLPKGGAPMPYCMYFNDRQALHGSPHVVYGNISHGCVRLRVGDARWIRYNFAERGTLVVILPYGRSYRSYSSYDSSYDSFDSD